MGVARTLSTRYLLEPDMRIAWTSANWDRFARENDAPELADGNILGRSLWDFISGEETRGLYKQLFGDIREPGQEAELPFRCDSPTARRFMTLRLKRTETDGVELAAELVREEPRTAIGLLNARAMRSGEPLEICSVCRRIETIGAAWSPAEEATSQLGLDRGGPFPPLDHTVCPDCRSAVESWSRKSAESRLTPEHGP